MASYEHFLLCSKIKGTRNLLQEVMFEDGLLSYLYNIKFHFSLSVEWVYIHSLCSVICTLVFVCNAFNLIVLYVGVHSAHVIPLKCNISMKRSQKRPLCSDLAGLGRGE